MTTGVVLLDKSKFNSQLRGILMLTKNQIYEATIVDYTAEGQGIAKVDGCVVFIPNAIVGETCLSLPYKISKDNR